VAGIIAYFAVAGLWVRNRTPRDRWNAIFLAVFSTMQWVDAAVWYLIGSEPGKVVGRDCSSKASSIIVLGLCIIILEPVACLIGSMYARKQWITRNEFLYYVVSNFTCMFLFGFVFIQPDCLYTLPCPFLTPDQHLLYGIGVNSDGLPLCWREYGFFGQPSYEIPTWLRFCFLLGMVYPYLYYTKPLGSGIIQSVVLIVTWLIGYSSDSHASVWCLANVLQVITMYMDPYWFPPSEYEFGAESTPNLRNIYSQHKVQCSWDYIVVGSGIGGLSSAALLSKAGYRVLVLEQHYRVGGCTHEFKQRHGYFDTGIHYIGGSGIIRNMLSFITAKPGVCLNKMGSKEDGYLYDEFDLGEGLILKYRAGKEAMRKELLEKFPEERAGIEEFFKQLKSATDSLDALVAYKGLPEWFVSIPFVKRILVKTISKAASKTAEEVINGCVKDKRLRALLSAGQLIDWNLKPDECSWAVVGGLTSYYINGGYYPIGGAQTIAARIIPVIERSGGRVLVHAKVTEFVTDDLNGPTKGTITGVRLKNGDMILAKHGVVSDMGVSNTLKAIPESLLEKHSMLDEVPGLKPSNGLMTASINLDGAPSEFDLRVTNIHSWTDLKKYDYNPSKMQEAFYKDPFGNSEGCLMTITVPCLKDPAYQQSEHTANILMGAEGCWEWFKDIDAEEVAEVYGKESKSIHGKRSTEYKDLKKKWEAVFLDRLYKYYPKTKGHVVDIQIGTPVTLAHFLGFYKGGSYGLAWTPKHFDESLLSKYFGIRCRVPGLYLTGESALFGGFGGAMGGGFLSALKILGPFKFIKLLLYSEPVDADCEHLKLRPDSERLKPEATTPMLLMLFASLVTVLLGGRKLGMPLARLLKAKLA